jgi:hypothetical protein
MSASPPEHPGLFSLMFRSELLDPSRPALRDAVADARGALRTAAFARAPLKTLTPLQLAANRLRSGRSCTDLLSSCSRGRLEGTVKALPGNEDAEGLLEAARVGE